MSAKTRTGDVYDAPNLGSRMRVLVPSETTGGERVVVEFTNEPMSKGPPPHLHPSQTEIYEVIEGRLHLLAGERTVVLGPGDSFTVPPGTPHTFWNEGAAPVRFTSDHRPALRFESFITSMYDLDYDGRCGPSGTPRNPLQLATMARYVQDETVLVGPPRWLQRIAFAFLGGVGGLLGLRPSYASQRRRSHATGE